MRKREHKGVFVTLFFAAAFVILIGVILTQINVPQKPTLTVNNEIPRMEIDLNGVALEEIYENGKNIKYLGNNVIFADGDKKEVYEDVEVKGRGNATWAQIKKPLQIKFRQKVDLLGLGSRKKWILLANYMDWTNLRTDTAFYIEKMVGEKYAYQGDFVELFVDDDYQGLYYLTRGIEVGKNAVDLRDPYGVLVELDNVYGQAEELYYVTGNGEHLTVKDVVNEDNIATAMEDFVANFNALEEAIKNHDYDAIRELIDVKSFAEYYLIEELTLNMDAYFTSQYFYKDGLNDKIHAGPAWDFDMSFNNYRRGQDNDPVMSFAPVIETEYLPSDKQYLQWSRLFARLIDIPEFRAEVDRVFNDRLAGRKDELLWHVFTQAARIYDAAMRDGEKWEKDGYVTDVKKMLQWLSARYDYMEQEYGIKAENIEDIEPIYDINIIEV